MTTELKQIQQTLKDAQISLKAANTDKDNQLKALEKKLADASKSGANTISLKQTNEALEKQNQALSKDNTSMEGTINCNTLMLNFVCVVCQFWLVFFF